MDTLFRGNSIACKVLSSSFKTFGLYYLQSVVRPLILQLLKMGDKDFEVDPARLSDTSKLAENQANLLDLVQTFCSTIISSLPSVPLQLRTVCHILYSVRETSVYQVVFANLTIHTIYINLILKSWYDAQIPTTIYFTIVPKNFTRHVLLIISVEVMVACLTK